MISKSTIPVSAVEAQLINRAQQKHKQHQDLTREERQALIKHEKQREEELRWQIYETIPAKHWKLMSGRQSKVILEQADRYQIPFSGARINLRRVVRRLHDFLAENAQRLARDDDPLMQGGSSPALERYREHRASIARLDLLEREGKLMPRDEARQCMWRIAALLRSAGETIEKQCGREPAEILRQAIEDIAREIDRGFAEAESESTVDTTAPI